MGNSVKAIVVTTIASNTLTNNYQAINPGGTEEACFLVRIVNNSNQPVDISYDGINDHDYIREEDTAVLNLQSNAGPQGFAAYLKKGTVVYAKGTAGAGIIALIGYYQ